MAPLVLLLAIVAAPALAHRGNPSAARLEKVEIDTVPEFMYKSECWKKVPSPLKRRHVPAALAQLVEGPTPIAPGYPGTGMEPKKYEPYVTIEKDGYSEVDCVHDEMLKFGDKFGNNKFDYNMGASHGVSIVRYDDIVAKEDREEMTRDVCYTFCRSVPNMTFFGLAHGRDCYCEPFFIPGPEASVFEMHLCADTAEDLGKAIDEASSLLEPCGVKVDDANAYAEGLGKSSEDLQVLFGQAGDPGASDVLQWAQGSGSDVAKMSAALEKTCEKLEEDMAAGEEMLGAKGGIGLDAERVKNAETTTAGIKTALADAEAAFKALQEVTDRYAIGDEKDQWAASLKQYKPVMYFLDKTHRDAPSTCGGTPVGKPYVGLSTEGCAFACDKANRDCVGFSFFDDFGGASICVLFSKVRSSTYYPGCIKYKSFLQAAKPSHAEETFTNALKLWSKSRHGVSKRRVVRAQKGQPTMCFLKFQQFEGLTLTPDPSGKCKSCLKELTKRDKCFLG